MKTETPDEPEVADVAESTRAGRQAEVPLFTPAGQAVRHWREWAVPRKASRWRPGKSAMELARAWFTSPAPLVPSEMRALLESHPLTLDLAIESGHAEFVTDLPGMPEGRAHGLLLRGTGESGGVTIGVEAMADETFGARLTKKLRQALEVDAESEFAERAAGLLGFLFDGDSDPAVEPWCHLRWRLITGAAATAIQAGRDGAPVAVFAVHEFRNAMVDPVTEAENLEDLNAFASLLGQGLGPLEPGKLAGPVRMESPLVGEQPVDLLVGWALSE
ncbi:MAG: DUF6946 family protein [Gemmatimonadales bacterium]